MEVRASERPTAGVIPAIALALALSVSFLDLTVSLLAVPYQLPSLASLLAPVAVTALVFFLSYAVLWFLFLRPLARRLALEPVALAAVLALFLGSTFLLLVLSDLLEVASWSMNQVVKLLLILCFCALMAVLAYDASRGQDRRSRNQRLILSSSLALPWLLGETAAVVSLHKYVIPSFYSLSSLAVTAAYAAVFLLTVKLALRVTAGTKVVAWLLPLLVLVLLFPLGILTGAEHRGGPGTGSLGKDRPIKYVILITIDTLRADALGCYGPQGTRTPHIDMLCHDSLRFSQAFAPAPWTLPSLATIQTGLAPEVHLTTRLTSQLPSSVFTWAERMRDSGYRTAAIGSNMFLDSRFNLGKGFLHYDVFPKPVGSSFGARLLEGFFPDRFDPTTQQLTTRVLSWLRDNSDEPFFLWVHYFDPHSPYTPPPPFAPPGNPPVPARAVVEEAIPGGPFVPSAAGQRWMKSLYEGEVRYVDHNVGRLLDTLKEQGLYEEALIILTSDHGEEFWEHGGRNHGHTLYNELLWVPLLIKLPFSSRRGEIEAPVSVGSLMATTTELAGLQGGEEDLSYDSLVPLWQDQSASKVRQPILGSSPYLFMTNPESEEDEYSVLFDGMKYIYSRLRHREELYDLTNDPGEHISVLVLHPDKALEARRILESYQERSMNLRKLHGIATSTQIQLDVLRNRLKALGYVQ